MRQPGIRSSNETGPLEVHVYGCWRSSSELGDAPERQSRCAFHQRKDLRSVSQLWPTRAGQIRQVEITLLKPGKPSLHWSPWNRVSIHRTYLRCNHIRVVALVEEIENDSSNMVSGRFKTPNETERLDRFLLYQFVVSLKFQLIYPYSGLNWSFSCFQADSGIKKARYERLGKKNSSPPLNRIHKKIA